MKLTAADRRWGTAVKDRDAYTCQRCFKVFPEGPARRGLHAHHIFTRGRGSTKHDPDNGVSLCYGHHRWAHANPLEFHAWVKGEIGEDAYDDLQARSRQLKRSGAA